MKRNDTLTPIMKDVLNLLEYQQKLYQSEGMKPYVGVTRFVGYDDMQLTCEQMGDKYEYEVDLHVVYRPTLSRLILAGYAEYCDESRSIVKLSNRPPIGFVIIGKKLGKPDFQEVIALECKFCGRLFKQSSYKKHRCREKAKEVARNVEKEDAGLERD